MKFTEEYPLHGTDTRNVILDAAEIVFGAAGFEGASMKQIAAEAKVAQSLIHYHFTNKHGLYVAVFSRRASQMNSIRYEGLDRILESKDLKLEDVLYLLLRPTVTLGQGETRHFSRLVMQVIMSGNDQSKKLISDSFDAFAKRIIGIIETLVPGITSKDAVWGYIFSINVAMVMMAPTGRPGRLSAGQCDDQDINSLLDKVVLFTAAGIRAFAHQTD